MSFIRVVVCYFEMIPKIKINNILIYDIEKPNFNSTDWDSNYFLM